VIDAVDLRQRFNQVNRVAFVSPELRPDRMSVDPDPQALPQPILSPTKAQNVLFVLLCPSWTSLLLAGCGSLGVVVLVTACIALTNESSLTAQSAQIIKFCSAHASSFHEIDMIDDGCVQREDSLDAHAKAGLPHSDGFACAAMFPRDNDAFESLQSLFGLGFLDPNVNPNRIAWLKFWNIIAQLRVFNFV
jgi:hypothetical protein